MPAMCCTTSKCRKAQLKTGQPSKLFEQMREGKPDELARRICHLAMEGERDPVRLHDQALGELIPATMWRELS